MKKSIEEIKSPTKEDLFKTANQLIHNKEFPKAIGILGEILNLDETDADAYSKLGFIYYKLGIYPFTIDMHTKAISYGANTSDNYFQRAYAYTKLKRYHEALKDLQKSQELGNKSPAVAIKMAICYRHLENYSEVIRILIKINLKDEPNRKRTIINLH